MLNAMTFTHKETIPPFSHDGYLPPFVGSPTGDQGRAPYTTNMEEFVNKFSFSGRRKAILEGFIKLRRRFFLAGIKEGFQWIDGSFTGNAKIEPGDIDVVTFFSNPFSTQEELLKNLSDRNIDLRTPGSLKEKYLCDAYFVDFCVGNAQYMIHRITYWYSLFSHTREKQWKGLLQIELPKIASEAIKESKLLNLFGVSDG